MDHLWLGKGEDREEARRGAGPSKPPPGQTSGRGPTFSTGRPARAGRAAAGAGSPSHHLAVVVLRDGRPGAPLLPGPAVAPVASLWPALRAPPPPVPLARQLPGAVVALLEEILGELVELHIQEVELLDAPAGALVDLHVGSPRDVELREGGDEPEVECPLEEKLRLALELREPEERHVLEVALGALQQDGIPLALVHESQVVAAHQAEVGQHAHLSVVGQVVGAVHELPQADPGPVVPGVAGGQLVRGGAPPVAHVQGGFPRGPSLDVFPLAQVSGHRIPQHGDVIEIPGRDEGESVSPPELQPWALGPL